MSQTPIVRKLPVLLLLFFLYQSLPTRATAVPSGFVLSPVTMPVHPVRKTKGFVHKMVSAISLIWEIKKLQLQKKFRRAADKGEPTEKQKKQARASMILGISSLVILFVPVLGILALPAAILAIVMGIISLKGNSNSKAITGIITGSVTILLIALAVAVLLFFIGV